MTKENFLGVDVSCLNMKEVLGEVRNIISNRMPAFIVAINPEKIMKAVQDQKLMQLLNSARIQIPDGVGVLYASRLNGGHIRSRVTGIDLMTNICELASNEGYRIFMLGAKPGVAEKAADILRERYGGIQIVGVQDGYFQDEAAVVEKISSLRADILFVAMGSPKQEYWITSHMQQLQVPLCMGVGGSYDVICGNINRAPQWMCKIGLEWFYRLLLEPWRIKRMAVLPLFLLKIISERVKK